MPSNFEWKVSTCQISVDHRSLHFVIPQKSKTERYCAHFVERDSVRSSHTILRTAKANLQTAKFIWECIQRFYTVADCSSRETRLIGNRGRRGGKGRWAKPPTIGLLFSEGILHLARAGINEQPFVDNLCTTSRRDVSIVIDRVIRSR